SYLELLSEGETVFEPRQPEDYCFARAFGFMTKEEGESRWPSLRGHESDRIEEMEKAIEAADAGREIESRDHRVIPNIVMRQKIKNKEVKVKHPLAVNKSWLQFWKFLKDSPI
ncbi:MAG: hypothetical protein V1944_02775, partial [Candidatus Aenigmatarchaeota archaeon]